MAMPVGAADEDEDVISAINTTPLVDVMLVLLIIFLITIPVIVPEVALKLPKETNQALQTKPENIRISIAKDGDMFWNNEYVPNADALFERLKDEAVKVPQPEVLIRGDLAGRYESIGKAVFACQRAGIQKIGFVTEPPARN
jgi:biopolymer transport protein ExbD